MNALTFAVTILALLNAAMQMVDLHTTSELIKRGYGKEDNPRLAKYMNDQNRPWHWRFWFLVAVKVACAALVLAPLTIIHQVAAFWLLVFIAVEVGVGYIYVKPMLVNWGLYQKMLKSLGN